MTTDKIPDADLMGWESPSSGEPVATGSAILLDAAGNHWPWCECGVCDQTRIDDNYDPDEPFEIYLESQEG